MNEESRCANCQTDNTHVNTTEDNHCAVCYRDLNEPQAKPAEPIQSDNLQVPLTIQTKPCGCWVRSDGEKFYCEEHEDQEDITENENTDTQTESVEQQSNTDSEPHVIEEVKTEVLPPETEIVKQDNIRDNKGKFLPGVSGNPNGRPKREWTWASLIEEYAEHKKEVVVNKETGERKKYTYRELVIKRLYNEAANGNMQAVREIFSRMDGMPDQNIGNTSGKNGLPSAFHVTNTNYANAIADEVKPAVAAINGTDRDQNTA